MTPDDLRSLALNFMLENYGRPLTLEPDARDQWHRDLGLLMHFANVAFSTIVINPKRTSSDPGAH